MPVLQYGSVVPVSIRLFCCANFVIASFTGAGDVGFVLRGSVSASSISA